MLANGVGDAFRFHLAGSAVYAGLLLVFGSVQVNIVQLCVGDFVNGGFERLQLAHILVKRDTLVLQVIISSFTRKHWGMIMTNRNNGNCERSMTL